MAVIEPLDEQTGKMLDRIVTTWANDHAAIAQALAAIDPALGAEVTTVADGLLVLCGPGMYVNTAQGVGRTVTLACDDWATIIERSDRLGVAPAIDFTPTTRDENRTEAAARGFAVAGSRDVFVQSLRAGAQAVATPNAAGAAGVDIVEIDATDLGVWQQTTADALEQIEPER